MIIKDRKTSTDLELTHIAIHNILKLVEISPFHQSLKFRFSWGDKKNADDKVIFVKHVAKTTICYGKMLFTLSLKHTWFLEVPDMEVTSFHLID